MGEFELIETLLRRPNFPLIAVEGVPFVGVTVAVSVGLYFYADRVLMLIPVAVLAFVFLVFRDPRRQIPAAPLGVVSPIDGVLERITPASNDQNMHVLEFRISLFGSYLARSPVEGKISNWGARDDKDDFGSHALLLRTDEGDDVVFRFHVSRFGIAPRGLKGYGERFGQGQRCAYLRLTRRADLYLPAAAQLLANSGDTLVAGETLLAKLPAP